MDIFNSRNVVEGTLNEVFNLAPLALSTELSEELTLDIISSYDIERGVNKTHIEGSIFAELFRLAGGTASTDVNTVLAFSYVTLNTPNMRFDDMVHDHIIGCHIYNMIKRAKDRKLLIPGKILELLYSFIHNVRVIECISSVFEDDIQVDVMSTLNISEFIDLLFENKNEIQSLNSMFNDLGISPLNED